MIIKPTANSIEVSSADAVANATLVRIQTGALSTITIKNGDAFVGSFIMPANTVEVVEKGALHTIEATATVNCTPIAYKS